MNPSVSIITLGRDAPYLAHVDASIPLPESMAIAELSNDCDRVQASVLGESAGDDLKRIGVSLEAVRLHARESLRVLRQQTRHMDFRRASTANKSTSK